MADRWRLAAVAVLVATVAAGATGVVATPGAASASVTGPVGAYLAVDPSRGRAGFCPDDDGVTVVVDFQELGGATMIRCAPGPQPSGLAALKNAGFQVEGTRRWDESFICRIEGRPGPDRELCIDTPPASAYWSYWHAPNGGVWTYSQSGVTARTPPKGSFEGWSFSSGRTATTSPPPRVAPVRPARATTAARQPTTPGQPGAPSGGGSQGDRGTSGAGPSSSDAPVAGASSATAPPPGSDPSTAPSGPGPDPTPASPNTTGPDSGAAPTDAGTARAAPVGDLPAADASRGVPVATLAGVGLLVLLVAGAVWTAHRRRVADGGRSDEG